MRVAGYYRVKWRGTWQVAYFDSLFNMWFLDALEEEIPEKDFDFIDNDPISFEDLIEAI